MFKVSPPQVSAVLCLLFLSLAPSAVIAQELPQQNDSAPMIDMTQQQPPAAPIAEPAQPAQPAQPQQPTQPALQQSRPPSHQPSRQPNLQRSPTPSLQPTRQPSTQITPPPLNNTQRPQRDLSNPDVDLPESAESAKNAENPGGGAEIPPDPNVLDNAINTPIYTRPISEAPPPLDGGTELPSEKSPYGVLAVLLWTCFIAAAGATGYFLYVRFGDKD